MKAHECALVLHNIRSVHNVGSLFRTADGAGVSQIFLTGYSPTPLDKNGHPRQDLHKVALGAEHSVKWEHVKNPYAAIKRLKLEGFFIIALELDKKAQPLFKFKTRHKKIALLVGNEVNGISKAMLAKCDAIVEIPMRGHKESLNVSVAGGVALYQLLK